MFERQQLGARAPAKCDGTFSVLSDTFCALYRREQRLVFRLGSQTFLLDDDTVVRVSGLSGARHLVVERRGKIVGEHKYAVTRRGQFPNDPTAFVESEDFDFGLFASNVSLDPARKNVLLQ